ncbi:MAG TPA: hypothetical protein VF297_28105 [Pyrinomonadaceae bacterium]
MDTKTEHLNAAQLSELNETDEPNGAGAAPSRRAFVEPEVSFPVDVLEATTFFQFTESGATN